MINIDLSDCNTPAHYDQQTFHSISSDDVKCFSFYSMVYNFPSIHPHNDIYCLVWLDDSFGHRECIPMTFMWRRRQKLKLRTSVMNFRRYVTLVKFFLFLYKINSLKKLVIGDCIIAKPSNGCTTRAKKFTRYLSFKLSCEEMRTRENNLAAVIKRSYLGGKVISASCDVD